jgi:hypothetical protein
MKLTIDQKIELRKVTNDKSYTVYSILDGETFSLISRSKLHRVEPGLWAYYRVGFTVPHRIYIKRKGYSYTVVGRV